MGLTIALETEGGKPIDRLHDPMNLLHEILPSHEDTTYQCLRFIDWYGDTVFNRLQMEPFLVELARIRAGAQEPEKHELLSRIESMAQRCKEKPHLYLKFYGD